MDVINEDSIKLSDSDRTLLKISDLTPDVTETQTCNDSSVKSDTDTTHEPVTESGNTPEECSETKTREETGSRVYSVDSGLDLGTGELDTRPGTAEEQQLYVGIVGDNILPTLHTFYITHSLYQMLFNKRATVQRGHA